MNEEISEIEYFSQNMHHEMSGVAKKRCIRGLWDCCDAKSLQFFSIVNQFISLYFFHSRYFDVRQAQVLITLTMAQFYSSVPESYDNWPARTLKLTQLNGMQPSLILLLTPVLFLL